MGTERWEKRSRSHEELRERLHDMDIYDQSLMDYKSIMNNLREFDVEGIKRNPQAALYINSSINLAKDVERDLFEIGHEVGIPTDQIRKDIAMAKQGGKYRNLAMPPTYKGGAGTLDLSRKRKIKKVKPKRKIVKCRCKK